MGEKEQPERQFYLIYSISQKPSAKLQKTESKSITTCHAPSPEFVLSWSHYIKLMRIGNADERNFYEIECLANNWSLKELQRQFDSAFYERLTAGQTGFHTTFGPG